MGSERSGRPRASPTVTHVARFLLLVLVLVVSDSLATGAVRAPRRVVAHSKPRPVARKPRTTDAAATVVPATARRPPRIEWNPCDHTFQCATVSVPLAYTEQNGPKIEIALERVPALSRALRAGSLLVNPGGPGGSGIAFVRRAARSILSPAALERYDVVGFDPRGVGRSTPLPCGSAQGRSATTGLDYVRALHDACVNRAAALTASITTANTARDMEQIRIALGDDRLNYLGISYGTYLGLVYADLFPSRVGRFIIDSAVDPTLRAVDLTVQQIAQYETNLRRVLITCVGRCPFADPDVYGRLLRLLAKLDATPITADPIVIDRRTTELLVLSLSKSSPALMFTMLANLDRGDGSDVPAIVRALDNRLPEPPDFEDVVASDAVYLQIACSEGFHPSASADASALAARVAAVAPVFARIAESRSQPTCGAWGTQVDTRPQPIAREGVAPMLFVGSIGDEVTPIAWTTALAQRWPGSSMLQVSSFRHGAIANNACATLSASSFLLDGVLPSPGTLCS